MSFRGEFKEFISKGNVVDMAVGVVVGGAFTSIVNSLVGDIITPVINMVTGKADVSELSCQIGSATLTYGKFLQSIINFLLIAFAMFCVIKTINTIKEKTAKKAEEEAATAGPTQEELLMEIRDLLKKD